MTSLLAPLESCQCLIITDAGCQAKQCIDHLSKGAVGIVDDDSDEDVLAL